MLGEVACAASQQHRPRGHLRWTLGDEAPGELPQRADRAGADGEPADRGVDAAGADDQVVVAGGAVAELDGYGVVALAELLQRYAHPDRHGIAVGCQDLVQVRTVQRQAGADVAPQGGEVDVGQQAAPVVANSLVRDQRCPFGGRGLQAQSTQRPGRVGWQVDARPGVRPGGFPLDDVGGETALPERSGGAETADPGADHEDAQAGADHFSPLAVSVDGSMFWLERNRLSGS
jgi:hypothetical protein